MTFERNALRYQHDAALRQCKHHFPIQRVSFFERFRPARLFVVRTPYLCRREPCRSSCRRSGKRGARNPPRENNPADRSRPGCSRRRAGPDPPRQRWPGSAAACRSELESGAEGRRTVSTPTYETKSAPAYKLGRQRTFR